MEFWRRLLILYGSDGYLFYISRRKYGTGWYAVLSFAYILYLFFFHMTHIIEIS